MKWPQTLALIAAIATLGVVVAISTGNIQAQAEAIQVQVEAIQAQTLAFQAEAAADRRAWQATMDAFREKADADREAFRAEMRRLAERQAHVEGALSTAAVGRQ